METPNGAEIEKREYDTYRFAFNFEGELTDGIDYSAGIELFNAQKELQLFQIPNRGKYYAALFGYGGPNCGLRSSSFWRC